MVRGGENKAGRFLEVVAYAKGGRKGAIWLPKGHEGWDWSRVAGELWKMLSFLGSKARSLGAEVSTSKGIQKGGGALVGDFIGKAAGLLSFAEAVRSPLTVPAVVGRPLVPSTKVDWYEVEKIPQLGRSGTTVQQVVDCFALERTLSSPLGKDRRADGSSARSCSGCRKACSIGSSECDASRQVDGSFKKILGAFGDRLDWVCGRSAYSGRSRTSSFGLKRFLGCLGVGRVYKHYVHRGTHLRDGSKRLGFMPNIKKAKRMGFAPIFGFDDFPANLSSLAPEAFGNSTASFLAFVECSSSIPSEVSAPEIVLEKSSTDATLLSCCSGGFTGPAIKSGSLSARSKQVSMGVSPSASSGSSGVLSGFLHRQAMVHPVSPSTASALVRPVGGDPPLSSSSEARSGLL
jgi:hypothetical protein